jgi:molybdenum cofactor synthesis domain-containing protein
VYNIKKTNVDYTEAAEIRETNLALDWVTGDRGQSMQAEIVTVGTELLLGKIVDTNAAYIAQQLATISLDLHCRTTVGDDERRIISILQYALVRSEVVVTSGGLGSTMDDVTRQAVARATGRKLVLDEELLAQIEAHFARHGSTMSENNRRQAYIPQGAIPIENPVGAAPAFIVETEHGLIVSLPGAPQELKHLMETWVVPFLREKLQTGQLVIKSETPMALPVVPWVEREETSEAPGEKVTAPLPLILKLTIPDSGRDVKVPLTEKKVSIGRLDRTSGSFPDVDLTSHGGLEKGVSRRHAEIIRRGSEVSIKDLGSINGTFLNRKKLIPFFPQALKSGDELRLGRLTLQISFQ